MSELDFDDDEPRDKKKPSKDKDKPQKRGRDLDEEDDRDDDRGSRRKRDDDDDYDDDYDDRKAPARKRGAQGGGIGDYISFKKLMIADAIPLVFWIGLGFIVAFGIYLIVLSTSLAVTAIIIILVGTGLWRVACETMAAIARSLETLNAIKDAAAPPPPK